MNKNFNFFTVSIFCDCDYKDIVSAIYQIKKTQIESNKIEIREEKSIIEEYYNPPSGGAHLPQFTCWESEKYPNKVFLFLIMKMDFILYVKLFTELLEKS